jgi:hypothetical protein
MNEPNTQLADIEAQFRAASQRAEGIVARVGQQLLAKRPRPNAWSVAECLAHLKISTGAYLPLWQDAFREARAAGQRASGPLRLDLWGRFFVWFLEPPPKLRFPAPQPFQPVATPIDRIKIVSPFDRRVRYSVWTSFCASAAHQRRHLWQAEQVAAALRG